MDNKLKIRGIKYFIEIFKKIPLLRFPHFILKRKMLDNKC